MKTILLTGATDGIGLETAKRLVALGHNVLIHGRNKAKLESTAVVLGQNVETYRCDLSRLADVRNMAQQVSTKHENLDAIIHNAGVFKTPSTTTADGLDIRFVVNAIAPYLLTKLLWPLMSPSSRIVNVSSAAQAPVNLDALKGNTLNIPDFEAYSQSKLAITMWSSHIATNRAKRNGPLLYAVNPGSLLSTNMVKEGFPGAPPKDVGIGADILVRAALSDEFLEKSGQYYDNDYSCFRSPHPDSMDPRKRQAVVESIENIITQRNIQLTL